MLYDKYKKELVDLMEKLAPKYNLHNVFRDFTALSAYAISNTVDIAQRAKREEY